LTKTPAAAPRPKIRTAAPAITRTYREELYAGRRVDLTTTRTPFPVAMSRIFDTMQSEGVVARVKRGREWIRPGLVASLGRMRRRQARFNTMVGETINEIKDVYRRIK
jgi:hypothetical protein